MGFFSWYTNDTNQPIWNVHTKKHKIVYLIDNKNNKWAEPSYAGYGVFGGKDFYILLAEMNNLEFQNYDDGRCKAIKFAHNPELFTKEDDGRLKAIKFAHNPKLLYPNLASSPDWKWVNEAPKDHEGQGFLED